MMGSPMFPHFTGLLFGVTLLCLLPAILYLLTLQKALDGARQLRGPCSREWYGSC